MKKVADLLIESLQRANVKRVYGITGDSANFVSDAISRSDIRLIHVRHEESAAFAAGAEASIGGNLGVCMGSSGPGSLHLVNGLYDAHRNHAPVLAILTDIIQNELGTNYIQEVAIKQIFEHCSCFCEYVQTADQFPRLLHIAMQSAISKNGVAALIVSGSILQQECKTFPSPYILQHPKPTVIPCDEELSNLAKLLNNNKKIVIFGGAGCKNAHKQVMLLAAKLNAPVGWAYRGKEALDHDNPNAVGMNGMLGIGACNAALTNCDVMLALGTDFAFSNEYPHEAKIIQIDIDGAQLGRRHPIHLGIIGDIAPTIEVILPLLKQKNDNAFCAQYTALYHKEIHKMEQLTVQTNDSLLPIFPELLTSTINKECSQTAIITADMGTPWAFMCRYIYSHGTRQFYTSSLHATMANALPDAIGIKLLYPSQEVIALCGDGGIGMLMGELLTVVQENIDIKIIVYNNSKLDFVSMEMKADGLLDNGTQLVNPNYAKVAQSIGIKGIRVERVIDLEPAIKEALASKDAVLVDVVVDPYSMIVPPHILLSQKMNFSEYLLKAAVDGRRQEIVETIESLANRGVH